MEAGAELATSSSFTGGITARGGYTFPPQVYLGGLVDYWFPSGTSATTAGARANASASAFDVLALIGYDWGPSGIVVVRPLGGLGVLHTEASVCLSVPGTPAAPCVNAKDTNVAGTLGVEALILLKPIEVGGEIRGLFGSGGGTAMFGAHVGTTF
jgi:hypothetical protein